MAQIVPSHPRFRKRNLCVKHTKTAHPPLRFCRPRGYCAAGAQAAVLSSAADSRRAFPAAG